MECYISKSDNWEWDPEARRSVKVGEIYKGFPIVSESQRKTAEQWAKTMQAIEIPEVLENCGVDGFDDRMNNKIFKVYYMANYHGKKIKLYFDMYVPQMLDLMQHGTIEKEIIKNPLVFIDRSRLVMKDGEYHKEYVEKELQKKILKETKAISTKDLKLGGCYSTTQDGYTKIYVGPIKGRGHFIIESGWHGTELKDPSEWSANMKITKSLGFKFAHADKDCSLEDIKKYSEKKRKIFEKRIKDAIKTNEERLEEAKKRASNNAPWGWSWEHYYSPSNIPKYTEEFELLDELDKLLSSIK